MKRDEQSPKERIATLGEQLIQVLEKEEDHAVIRSALALVTAAGCGSLVGEAIGELEKVAEGFVRTFRGIIARNLAAVKATNRMIH